MHKSTDFLFLGIALGFLSDLAIVTYFKMTDLVK